MTSTINGRLKNWKLIGVFVFLYSIVHLPSLNNYWSRDPLTHYAPITTRRRFREISRLIGWVQVGPLSSSICRYGYWDPMGTSVVKQEITRSEEIDKRVHHVYFDNFFTNFFTNVNGKNFPPALKKASPK